MATSIDNLQIEIQSNSSGAARGIDDIASSLENLKKNGSVGVAVKNLRNLSETLKGFTTVNSTATSVSNLATALSALKNVGSLNRVANGVPKLTSALAGLKATDLTGVDEKIKAIANATAPLSTIKTGGLNTTLNALSKIGQVTSGLDDNKIKAFADKVTKLSTALTPLSTKMVTVQAGFRSINTTARSAGAGVRSMGNSLNTTSVNMSSFIYIAQSVISVLSRVADKLADVISEAIAWDGVSARFGRGFGEQASETYAWIQRLNEEMNINVQTFMQYSSVYATMLNGFGVAAEDASKMALGYTELTYDIWAGYNDIYKSYSDAADAVRSAISGEVEPIRRAGFTIVESQLEQTAANYGLEISLEKATEAQKSYLRYLVLVDQAYEQNLVGTYAKELNTAEGMMRTFSQSLKSLTQSLGSMFLPVLVKIMPYVQAFVELLTEAVQWIAGLFGVEIQSVDWSDYDSGIGGITDSAEDASDAVSGTTDAIKELKNATIGMDELNIISPPDTSSGSGSPSSDEIDAALGNLDIDSLWDESIFDGIQDKADEIKEKIGDWLPVIEGVGAALAGLGIANLLAHMGEALSQMNLLQKALATVAIVAIEASLVFTFADNYLESGNIMNLIGEALVTAGAGYLLFKTWGDKGAVFGMAVSVAAQLAAITLNVADGTVDIDDPELWLQTAMTTLTAGAGGYFAFKNMTQIGGVKGALLGAAIGLSLSLAAMTIGGVAADGFDLTDALTGLLSTAIGGAAGAGLFSLLGIATGGTGFLVGGAIMLAVNVIGAIIASVSKSSEEAMQKDLESRFGSVELSVEEISVVVKKLTPEWAEGVFEAVDLREQLDTLGQTISSQISTLGGYEWKVSVGIGLTEEEFADYSATINNFISTVQKYVTDRGYALEVGLKATGATDSIIASANAISTAASGELIRLGTELQNTINDAYEDGLLDIDELKAIQTIRNDMLTIQNALASSEIEAEFSMLEMKWSGVELTPESFQNILSEWNTVLNDEVKPALESTVKENLKTLEGHVAFAKVQLEKNPGDEEAKQLLEDAEKALQDYIDQNPLETLTLEASFEAVNFALNTLQDAYAAELEQAKSEGWFDYTLQLDNVLTLNPSFTYDEGLGEVYGNISAMAANIQSYMESETKKLSKETRDGIEEMIKSMQPTMADFEEIAAANRTAGQTVTQSVREGLNDYNQLKALSGDVDGINYLIGQGFSTDPTFLNTLATVEDAAGHVTGTMREGLLNNLDYVTDASTGLIIGIKDATTGETIAITPTLERNLRLMGVNMGNALGSQYTYVYDETTGVLTGIVDSVTGNEVWLNTELETAGEEAGKNHIDGFKNGIETNKTGVWDKVKNWCSGVLESMRNIFQTHSPSKATEAIGKDLADGLKNGMSTSTITTRLQQMWSNAKSWWDNSKGNLAAYTPSIGSIQSNLSTAWSTAKTWWNNNKGALSTYTPSIGSISSKLSSVWSAAKTWWNSKGNLTTYTPEIGSISSKLSSAWSTAKKWWNNSKGSLSTYTPSIGNIKTNLYERWKDARNWWSTGKASLSYTPTIGNIKSRLQSAWNTAKSWWSSNVKLSIPSLSFKITYTTPTTAVKKAIVNALNLSGWPTLSFAARGGMFDAGSLIWAGERGAEIVANAAGGKTGVMNVDQMSDAVYEGVYAAVTAAMRTNGSSNGTQEVNVYLDGRQISRAVEKSQHERGATIISNPAFVY